MLARPVTLRVPTLPELKRRLAALRVLTFVVERLEVPVTLRDTTFTVADCKLRRFETPVTLRPERLLVPVTLRVVLATRADALRVVTFVVERLEVPVTFKEVPRTDVALRVARLETPVTFRVPMFVDKDCKLERLAVLTLSKGAPRLVTFPVATFRVERFETPVTFRAEVTFSVGVSSPKTRAKEFRFEIPETLRDVRVPTEVTLG